MTQVSPDPRPDPLLSPAAQADGAIRPATAEDLPEVHRMLIALAAHQGDQAAITPALLRAALDQPGTRLLVACLADSPARHPVGYLLLTERRDLITGRSAAVIEQLFVQMPFRSRGLGRALLAAARAAAQAQGATGLTLAAPGAQAARACRALGLTELPATGPRFAVAL